MADGFDLPEILRRTVQANARFYKGWMDLSLEYIRGMSEILGGVEPQAAAFSEELDATPGVVVAEGEEGATVQRAFLVTNDLGRTLSCELYASEFRDAAGATVAVPVTFEPSSLDLAPGEQRVVRAVLPIAAELVPGVAYSGAFAIKGLAGFSVPVVLRRQHRAGQPAAPPQAATSGSSPAAEARGARKSASPRKPTPPDAALPTGAPAPAASAVAAGTPAQKRASRQKD